MSAVEPIRKWISRRTPWFIEDSRLPICLSYLSPIDIGAITLGPLVFSRGKISETTRRHETIHLHQQLELLFFPFFILYFLYWVINIVKGNSGSTAYECIPFEKEARTNKTFIMDGILPKYLEFFEHHYR